MRSQFHPRLTRSFAVALLAVTLLAGCQEKKAAPPAAEGGPDPAKLRSECEAVAQSFAAELKGELQAAIASGGPVQAIGVCKEKAPAIAARLSQKHGWEVGRTSLKLRNPANQPDQWERRQLEQFAEQAAAGADAGTLHAQSLVDGTYRFMKAIPIQAACLLCHGEQIRPDLEAALAASYPDDQARGYQPGDIRGAFTITIPAARRD